MDERSVCVVWDVPCSRTEVLTKKDIDKDCGLYQIYGHHVVFGPGSLLYVGMTGKRSFGTRFSEHEAWLQYESDILIRLGRLRVGDYKQEPDWADWAKLLGDVEALTIYWHTPPYNSHHITRYKGPSLRIRNMGDRGRLLPEYSSHWDAPRPDDNNEK